VSFIYLQLVQSARGPSFHDPFQQEAQQVLPQTVVQYAGSSMMITWYKYATLSINSHNFVKKVKKIICKS
jgi:hypothetical protein